MVSETPPHCSARCQFYVKTKKRFCKFPVVESHGFCYTHAPTESGTRVVCPLDPSHTIYEAKRLRHIINCTKVRDVAYELLQPFILENVNVSNKKLCKHRFPLDMTFSDFVEKHVSPQDSLHDIKPWNETPVDHIEILHTYVDTLYQKCCAFLEKNPYSFLKGFDCLDEEDHTLIASYDSILQRLDAHGNHYSLQLLNAVEAIRRTRTSKAPIPNESVQDAAAQSLLVLNKHHIQHLYLVDSVLTFPSFSQDTALDRPIICIEFGAGRGGLSQWLSTVLKSSQHVLYIQIDREKRRHIREKKSLDPVDTCCTNENIPVLRLRTDIRHFHFGSLLHYITNPTASCLSVLNTPPLVLQYLELLGCFKKDEPSLSISKLSLHRDRLRFLAGPHGCKRLDLLYDHVKCVTEEHLRTTVTSNNTPSFTCLCVAKHLCGNATDYALRCIVNGSLQTRWNTLFHLNILFATCCHHRITWNDLLGHEWLEGHLGLSGDVFGQLRGLSGWATGAKGLERTIGIKVKRIIDTARVAWLRDHGFSQANLEIFIPPSHRTTLENVAIKVSSCTLSKPNEE